MQHIHLDWWLDTILDLGEPECCTSSILVFTLKNHAELNFRGSIYDTDSVKKGFSLSLKMATNFFNWLPLWKFWSQVAIRKNKKLIACHVEVGLPYVMWDSPFISVHSKSCFSLCLYDFRSPHNHKLFVVAEDHNALKKSLDHLDLFSEDNLPHRVPVRLFFTDISH